MNEDFTRDTADDTVLYVVAVKDCTDAKLWSEETSRPSEAEDETVENVVDVNDCAEAPDTCTLIAERPEETVEKVVEVNDWTDAPDCKDETIVSEEVAVLWSRPTDTAFESAVDAAADVAEFCDFTAPFTSSASKP